MKRPNVLLLYTDEQRWDTIRYGGNDQIHTPHLDALAKSGALFQNAFCNSPVCMPSRMSLLSGQYPSTIGCTCNGIEMPEDVLTVHKVLKPYGYHTTSNGKLHFLNHAHRDHREAHPTYGFDQLIVSDDFGCYEDAYIKWVAEKDPSQVENCRNSSAPAVTKNRIDIPGRTHAMHKPYAFHGPEELTHSAFVAEETIDYMRRHHHEPFYAIAGFFSPHGPVNPPQRFVDMYDPDTLSSPHMNEDENRFGLSDHEWRVAKAYYYALITHVDDQVGRIMGALDEMGLREDTLVIFTSDHGDHMGDHGRTGKRTPEDSCTRIPLIASYPRRMAARGVYSQIIEQVDIAATILDYCGVQTPPIMPGRSVRPLLEGGGYVERTSAFIEHRFPFGESWKAVRTADYEYVTYNTGQELLYDMQRDPHQLRDVSGDASYAAALHAMRAEILKRWFDVEAQYPLRTGVY